MSSQKDSTPCVILGCSSSNTNVINSSKTFHKFPSSPVMRNRWDRALTGHKWVPVWIQEHRWRVCSDHFPASDFLPSGELRPRAVPSLLKRLSTMGSWFKDEKPKNYQSVKLKRAMVPRISDSTSESNLDDLHLRQTYAKTPMPRTCCVRGCGKRIRTKKTLQIPKSGNLRKRWIDVLEGHMHKPNVEIGSELRVCMNHFPAIDFLTSGELHPRAVPTLLKRSVNGRWRKAPTKSVNASPEDMSGSHNEGGNEMSSGSPQISGEPRLDLASWKPEDGTSPCPGNLNPMEFVQVKIESDSNISNVDSSKVPSSCLQDPLSEPSDLTIVETLEETQRPTSPADSTLMPKLPRPLAYMSCSEVRTALCKVF